MESGIRDEILEVCRELIRFKTTEDRPEELATCCDYMAGYLGVPGLKVETFNWENKPSLVASLGGGLEPELMLNGHFDVVAAEDGQFEPKLDGDRLYGRGTSDMKGALATMMVLVKRLALDGGGQSLVLMLNGDEEIGGYNGARRLLDAGYKPGFFLAGEPTFNRIGYQAKGILRLKLTFRGKACHGARPWEGKSALLACLDDMTGLRPMFDPERARDDWVTSYTPTLIDGGDIINKVPDSCCLSIDIRFVPGDDPDRITADIRKRAGAAEVEVLMLESPAECPRDHPGIELLGRAVESVTGKPAELIRKNEGSDARFFAAAGIGAVVFGPAGDGWHGPNEWIELGPLVEFYRIIEALVRENPA
jgi:succinyl-diaminopimelate desuccinylase